MPNKSCGFCYHKFDLIINDIKVKTKLPMDKNKTNLLLLNKSDLLTIPQRKYWAKYFDSRAVTVAFYSAKQSEETIEERNEDANETVSIIII